jgi:hypothetical protein
MRKRTQYRETDAFWTLQRASNLATGRGGRRLVRVSEEREIESLLLDNFRGCFELA